MNIGRPKLDKISWRILVNPRIRECERSGKRSGPGRKSGGAGVAESDGAGAERGTGGRGAGTDRGAG